MKTYKLFCFCVALLWSSTILLAQSPEVIFGGLKHNPLGKARISKSKSGFLQVSNLEGASDGVSISTSGADFLLPAIGLGQGNDLPIGEGVQVISLGGKSNAEEEFLGAISLTAVEDNLLQLKLDYANLGVQSYVIDAELENGETIRVSDLSVEPEIFIPWCNPLFCDPPPFFRVDPVWLRDDIFILIDRIRVFDPEPLPWEPDPEPWVVKLEGQELNINRLILKAEGVDASALQLNRVDILSQGSKLFNLNPTGFGKLGEPYYAIGDVELGSDPSGKGFNLRVREQGEFQGISATFPSSVPRFFANLTPINLTKKGAITLQATGIVNGEPGSFLGESTLSRQDNGAVLSVDYRAIESKTTLLEIYQQGQLVRQVVLPIGEIGLVDGLNGRVIVDGCGKVPPFPRPLPCIIWQFRDPIEFREFSGVTSIGDEIRVLAPDAGVEIGNLNSFSILTQDIDQFGIQSTTQSIGEPLLFDGLNHSPIGTAELSINRLGEMQVNNLGGSGGLSVSNNGAGFLLPALRFPEDAPKGAQLNIESFGIAEGSDAPQFLGQVSLINVEQGNEDLVQIIPEFLNLGAQEFTAEVQDADDIVISQGTIPLDDIFIRCIRRAWAIRCDIWILNGEILIILDALGDPTPQPSIPEIDRASSFILGGQEVLGQKLILTSRNLDFGRINLERLNIIGEGLDSFILSSQGLGQFMMPHYALGDVSLGVREGALVVSGMDNSGKEGLGVAFTSDVPHYSANLSPLDLTNRGSLILEATGVVNGEPYTSVGRAELLESNEGLSVVTNYDKIGSENTLVEVYNQGKLVGRMSIPSGRIGSITGSTILIDGCDKVPLPIPDPIFCYIIRFRDLIAFNPVQVPFGNQEAAMVGDEIRLLADDAKAKLGGLNSFSLLTQNVKQLVIESASQEFDFGIQGFTLVNSENNEVIPGYDPIPDNAVINLNKLGGVPLAIRANTEPEEVGSMFFDLDGPMEYTATENIFPYSLFGDRGVSNLLGKEFAPGSYSLKGVPFTAGLRRGVSGDTTSISFRVACRPGIRSLDLIDANADKVIRPFKDELKINLGELSNAISVTAQTYCTKSVVFILRDANGQMIHQQTESISPFALFGDNLQGDFYPWNPKDGDYELEVIPCSETGGKGAVGQSVTVKFSIAGSTNTAVKLLVYPNPATEFVHVKLSGYLGKEIKISLWSFTGDKVYEEMLNKQSADMDHILDLKSLSIPRGRYFIQVQAKDKTEILRQVIDF